MFYDQNTPKSRVGAVNKRFLDPRETSRGLDMVHGFPLVGLLEAVQFLKLVPLSKLVFKPREFLRFEFHHFAAFLQQYRFGIEICPD